MAVKKVLKVPYALRDYERVRDAAITKLSTVAPTITNLDAANPAVAFIEYQAGLYDNLSYNIDMVANEQFLATALERKNVLKLVRPLGYKPESLVAATTAVIFTVSTPATANITIPAYTSVKASDAKTGSVSFVTVEPAYILKGQSSSLTFRQETGVIAYYNASAFTISTGGNKQQRYLSGTRVRVLLSDPAQSFETTVSSTTYANGINTIYLDDAILNSTLYQVQYGSSLTIIKQGRVNREYFTHDGSQWFTVQLSSAVIAEGTIKVTVDGVPYELMPNLLKSSEEDLHCTWNLDANNIVTISFGNGTFGYLPDAASQIAITYIETDGERGMVAANKVTHVDGTILDDNGSIVTVQASNPTPAVGGRDREVIERIKFQAPRELEAQKRMVRRKDWDAQINGIPGINSVRCYDIDDDRSVPFRVVEVYAIPEGGGQLSQGQKDEVEQFARSLRVIGTLFEIKDVVYQPINVTVNVYLYSGYVENEVKANIISELEYFISPENLGIGINVVHAEIHNLVSNITGVASASVTLAVPNSNPVASNIFIYKGQQAIFNSATINVDGVI